MNKVSLSLSYNFALLFLIKEFFFRGQSKYFDFRNSTVLDWEPEEKKILSKL